MKRSAKVLQQERTESEADARLRKKLELDAEAEERAQRVASLSATKAKTLDTNLKQWKQAEVIIASDHKVGVPAQSPLGPHSQASFTPLLPRHFKNLRRPRLVGATASPSVFPRNPTHLESVLAFFPKQSASLIANMASSNFFLERTRSQAQSNRHYNACTENEILLWIAHRCEFTLDIKDETKQAYKNVSF